MYIYSPSLVLILDTFLSPSDAALAPGKRSASTSLWVEYISEEFPGVQIDAAGRRYWNDPGGKLSWTFSFRCFEHFLGLESVLQLCVDDEERGLPSLYLTN